MFSHTINQLMSLQSRYLSNIFHLYGSRLMYLMDPPSHEGILGKKNLINNLLLNLLFGELTLVHFNLFCCTIDCIKHVQ